MWSQDTVTDRGEGKTRDGVAWGVVWARENGLDEKENKSAAH